MLPDHKAALYRSNKLSSIRLRMQLRDRSFAAAACPHRLFEFLTASRHQSKTLLHLYSVSGPDKDRVDRVGGHITTVVLQFAGAGQGCDLEAQPESGENTQNDCTVQPNDYIVQPNRVIQITPEQAAALEHFHDAEREKGPSTVLAAKFAQRQKNIANSSYYKLTSSDQGRRLYYGSDFSDHPIMLGYLYLSIDRIPDTSIERMAEAPSLRTIRPQYLSTIRFCLLTYP